MKIYKCYVYVLYTRSFGDHNSENGFIKIGMSYEPRKRLESLRIEHSIEKGRLIPIFLLELKTRALAIAIEAYFLNMFAKQSVGGEWFRYTIGMSNFFKKNIWKYGEDKTKQINYFYSQKNLRKRG